MRFLVDQNLSPTLAELLLANLDAVGEDLNTGAIVVVEDERVRVRRLPI